MPVRRLAVEIGPEAMAEIAANLAPEAVTRLLDGGLQPRRIHAAVVAGQANRLAALTADHIAVLSRLGDAGFARIVGLPEARIPLAQGVTYLASAPKSNAAFRALGAATADVKAYGTLPVPLELRNAATPMMHAMGYGTDYRYPHDYDASHVPGETYLPDALAGRRFYEPSSEGLEQSIRDRLERLRRG